MNYKLQDSNIKTTEIGLNIGQLVWRQHIGWKPVERIMVIAAYFTRSIRAFFFQLIPNYTSFIDRQGDLGILVKKKGSDVLNKYI